MGTDTLNRWNVKMLKRVGAGSGSEPRNTRNTRKSFCLLSVASERRRVRSFVAKFICFEWFVYFVVKSLLRLCACRAVARRRRVLRDRCVGFLRFDSCSFGSFCLNCILSSHLSGFNRNIWHFLKLVDTYWNFSKLFEAGFPFLVWRQPGGSIAVTLCVQKKKTHHGLNHLTVARSWPGGAADRNIPERPAIWTRPSSTIHNQRWILRY